jgi:Ankyrin repeats (many copies)/Ankyrin repeat
MTGEDGALMTLIGAIVADDRPMARGVLAESPALATASLKKGATRQQAQDFWLDEIEHYVYLGDTPLHVAAAAYRAKLVDDLIQQGAQTQARNRRGATPLHYAADGAPGSRTWNPRAQHETIVCLLDAGSDPNAVDKGGTTPLHRAIRNRCAAAVAALLEGGADRNARNGRGSTPEQLAEWTTGRGGSGSPEARAQQEEIVRLLRQPSS